MTVQTEIDVAPEPPPEKPRSLKALAIRGSMWTIGGSGVSMVLRMGSNLILTRILMPEAFGLMAIVNVFVQGLEMFSDLGVRVSIIQHPRGGDRDFLNTAWTLQVVRGWMLWFAACAIAWPACRIYGQPELASMIPVAGFTCVINAFQSTKLTMLNRRMLVGKLFMVGITSQVVAMTSMVAIALWTHSVWALLVSGIVNATMHTVLSFLAVPGENNHFHWDPEARRALMGFGKWVFFSTIVTFLSNQSDKLILGRYFDAAVLGVYSIAANLSGQAIQVLWDVCQWVLMPAFSQVHREDSGRLRTVYDKVRRKFDIIVMPALGLLIAAGDVVVHLLWDERYRQAGWMFNVLTVGVACYYTLPFAWCCQVAKGQLRYWVAGNIGRVLWMWIGVPLVWNRFGFYPTIWFVSLSQLPPLIFAWVRLRKDGILSLRRELLAMSYLAVGYWAGWILKHVVLKDTWLV